MRFGLLVALCLVVASARGQEQERKLVDRLLEPNRKLENSQQHKQFTEGSSVTTASASTRPFFVPERKLDQNFAGTRQFATTSFQSRAVETRSAHLSPPHQTRAFATKETPVYSAAREASTKCETRQFAGNRPFLGRGKSQQALRAQDHPLSIDDIRELLNKNK